MPSMLYLPSTRSDHAPRMHCACPVLALRALRGTHQLLAQDPQNTTAPAHRRTNQWVNPGATPRTAQEQDFTGTPQAIRAPLPPGARLSDGRRFPIQTDLQRDTAPRPTTSWPQRPHTVPLLLSRILHPPPPCNFQDQDLYPPSLRLASMLSVWYCLQSEDGHCHCPVFRQHACHTGQLSKCKQSLDALVLRKYKMTSKGACTA